MTEHCETINLSVELQENGIIRLPNGRLIARLCCEDEGYDFEGIRKISTMEGADLGQG